MLPLLLVIAAGCSAPAPDPADGVGWSTPTTFGVRQPSIETTTSAAPADAGHVDHQHGTWTAPATSAVDPSDPVSVAAGWMVASGTAEHHSPPLVDRVGELSTARLIDEVVLETGTSLNHDVELFVDVLAATVISERDGVASVEVVVDHVRLVAGHEEGVNVVVYRLDLVEIDGRWLVDALELES